MLKNYLAVYRKKRNGNIRFRELEDKNKKEVSKDIRSNGYRSIIILSQKNINHILECDYCYNINISKLNNYKYQVKRDIFQYINEEYEEKKLN